MKGFPAFFDQVPVNDTGPGKFLPIARCRREWFLIKAVRGRTHPGFCWKGYGKMKTSSWNSIFVSLCVAALLTGCGTTSNLKTTGNQRVDLTRFDRLLVSNFKDEFSAKARPVDRPKQAAEGEIAGKLFADRIAAVVKAAGVFREVVREGPADAQTLLVSGAITRYESGDAVLRLWIGLGAGSSYFDARVELVDGGNNVSVGTWLVDKNSWGLGGAIAASQTVDEFMKAAAEKVGKDLVAQKQQGFTGSPAAKK